MDGISRDSEPGESLSTRECLSRLRSGRFARARPVVVVPPDLAAVTRSRASTLDYSTDSEPGIARCQANGAFVYHDARGRALRSAKSIARIEALAIPPAWTDVWICPNPNGHLQATGKDVRGRKQYRYHPLWVAERDTNKFDSLREFALALPGIRRRVLRDLSRPQLTKKRVLAAVVQLMDRTFIRVGGERYRRENGSFGATTLRNRHVKVEGEEIYLDFRGKSGKRHRIEIQDRQVASVIRRCLDLPGQLFTYRASGEVRSISAGDVNQYLRMVSGAAVTSKDFRTWGGTVHAADYLAKAGLGDSKKSSRLHVRNAIHTAARLLGNTPVVCRRSYIHPAVFACYEAGVAAMPRRIAGLRAAECAMLSLLELDARRSGEEIARVRASGRGAMTDSRAARARAGASRRCHARAD